jgi:hypothetical protein
MVWACLCLFALLVGQVERVKTEPTPAVRPPATETPKTVPGAPASKNDPNAPFPPPASDAAQNSIPGESQRTDNAEIPKAAASPQTGRIPDAGDIPDAANLLSPPASSTEPPPTNVPSSPPNAPDRAKNQVQEMVAESLQIPPGGTIAGQPWPLAQALAASTDKKQQLLIIHGYWQSAEALAKYHFAFEQTKQIEQLHGRQTDDAALRAAQAAAAATLRESELALLSAQYDLAALVGLPAESALPLPGDKPHVGGYRTNYQGLFGMRSPPPIARVIDRTLPIRFAAIKERAAAVQAAEDAYLAATEAYQAGQTDFAAVMSSGGQLLHERRALIETVCRYNHDIAEYAVSVLGPNISAQQLVGALIETGRGAIEPRSSEKPDDVRPVEYLQPMTPSGQLPSAQPTLGQPTPALRPVKNQPTLAPIETRPAPARNPPAFSPPSDDHEADQIPAFNHSANKVITDPNRDRALSPEPAATASGDIAERTENPTSNHLSVVAAGAAHNPSGTNNTTALYPALVEAAPAVRAKQLALALHWDHSLPENSAKPMSLAECLAREGGGNRRETLAVFWTTRQRAAEYQAIAQEADFLESLSSDALERHNEPAGAVEMLYLRAARLSAKAALNEAQAALIESQFELALRTQSTAEKIWPLASTPPHSGSYELNLSVQPRQLVQSQPMLRLTTFIPTLGVSVQEHAAAVIEADAARSAAVETYLSGAKPLGSVLQAITLQTHQTFAFLQTLTDYNRSIADFALAVLPADMPADKLAAALVVQP